MDLNQKEIIVSQRQRPFWQLIIASFLYTFSLFFLFYGFYKMYLMGLNETNVKVIKGNTSFFSLSLYAFFGGLKLSIHKTIFINTVKQKLKSQYSVGIIKVNYHSEIPELKYVSIFKNPKSESIEINLWYGKNKHFNVSNFEFVNDAMDFGLLFSNKLNIDLLDATEKGNFKWIDKTEL
jgi:hypothetical protein